jgi:hypothetical protein
MNSASIKAIAPAPASTSSKSPAPTVKESVAKNLVSPWALAIATCLLLAASGGIRFWRDHQFRVIARESETCPFPLREFPKVLGTWYADADGTREEPRLDPEIARIAGAAAYFVRNYTDKKTNETVLALVLYGPADSVFGHSPEICYPASGYRQIGDSVAHQFSDPTSPSPMRFRSAFFSKDVGGITRYEEVYYTFYHNQQWLPEVANQWKSFRYHPGMFKLLLQRQTTDLSTENSPTESLLKEIVREINVRLAQTRPPATTAIIPGKTAWK